MNRNIDKISAFIKINFLLTTTIFMLFFLLTPKELSLIFWFGALISTSSTLYLIYYLLFKYFFRHRVTLYILGTIFIFTDFMIILDFFIFRVWRFHINGMVLNILLSPSAYKSLDIGLSSILYTIVIVISLIITQFIIYKLSEKAIFFISFNRFFNRVTIPMLIFITVVEKFTFGFASLFDNKNITLATKNIPLYQPLTFNSIAEKYFGYEKRVKKRQTLSISNSNGVEYPIKKVELESPKAINIFMIGIDGLRDDMITPEITPNIYRFAKESLWFRGNRSGGNATRFGIFTLFYGLNSQYWFNFIDAKREPVFFDVLKRLNYDISILFSTSTKWPEFRETVFFGVQEKIKDRIDSKDTKTFEMWMRYIENIPKNRAIFNFTFFNAPHGRYYPKKFAKFKPDRGGEINYLLVKKRDKNVLLNQYKNAIHYDDYLFGKMVDRLKQKALYKNSIIILTSDHGEEFYEYGYFGHNTAFDVAQTNSPIVIKIPNQKAKVIKKLSSTLDLIPSLLKLLGVVNSPSDYSNGVDNLFSESYLREFATSGNWNYSAIVTPKFTYLFSTLPNRVASTQKLYTETYREIDDEVDIADSLMQKFIIEVLNQNRRFLKSN